MQCRFCCSLLLGLGLGTRASAMAFRKKVVIVGDGRSSFDSVCDFNDGCGKTSLAIWLAKDLRFDPNEWIPTVLDSTNTITSIEVDEKQVEVELFDTAGHSAYDRIRKLVYGETCNTDVVLMCFSVDSPKSLKNISEKWSPEVKRFCPNVPIILVGNKKDTRIDQRAIREQNQELVKPE